MKKENWVLRWFATFEQNSLVNDKTSTCGYDGITGTRQYLLLEIQ